MSKMSKEEIKNQMEELKKQMPTIVTAFSQSSAIYNYITLVGDLRGEKLTDKETIPVLQELERITPRATTIKEDIQTRILYEEQLRKQKLEEEAFDNDPKAVMAKLAAQREATHRAAQARKEAEIAKKEEEIALKKLKFEKLEQMQKQNELLLKQTKLQEQALTQGSKDDLSSKMTQFMDDMVNQVKGISGKVETLCTRVNEIDHRMDNIDSRFDAIMQTLASMNLTQASTHNLLVQTTQQFSHIASTVYTPSIHGSHTEDVTSIGMSPEHDHPGN